METDRQFVDFIKKAKNIVFFGGAGVSTESGIPDFRGAGGLYTSDSGDELSPEQILHRRFFMQHPERFYQYYRTHMLYPEAKPNQAHIALAKLERAGKLSAVITQNIDGLHQKAGSVNVIELHGSTLRNFCTVCRRSYGVESILESTELPLCLACGGLIRPDVVLYGEALPGESWQAAEDAIAKADMLIIGGTSLTVQPAAGLAVDFEGDCLVIMNRTSTPYDRYANLVIRDSIAAFFDRIDAELFL